jgi:hypothetical protein
VDERVEEIRVEKEVEEANKLLQEGWDLFSVVSVGGGQMAGVQGSRGFSPAFVLVRRRPLDQVQTK